MHIIGMAGHVDHGKSALVTALTGTNPDRWLEEQLRGMTLDLGFAHLVLGDDLEAGIIDVPGHERFVHNMLAGAAGMELLLLVIAANEGVMPQTREHLQILHFLSVRRTIVAVSKCDLVPKAERGRRLAAIGEGLRGTIADRAPLVEVSAISTEGLEALREEIARALRDLPSRPSDAPAYLPVDRAFTLDGVGTVVTGTLMQGTIGVGDALVLQPGGKETRVRSLQTFGRQRERVNAGARTALNLAGIGRDEVMRGAVIASRELPARSSLRVRFEPAFDAIAQLRRRNMVRVHLGAAEINGTLVLTAAPSDANPVDAEIFLRSPAVAFPGVRFVVRRLSPKTLLGGGIVTGSAPALVADGAGEHETVLRNVLVAKGLAAIDIAAVAFEANLREEIAQAAIDELCTNGVAIRLSRPAAYMDAAAAQTLLERATGQLEGQHAAEPWSLGLTSVALSRALHVSEALLVRVLAAFAEGGRVAVRGGYYACVDHQPRLTREQSAFFERISPQIAGEAFAPVEYGAVLAAVQQSPVSGIVKAFETTLARGVFVRIGDSLYRGTQIRSAHAALEKHLREHRRITMAEFRDLLGTSRKYAVPLMEWFDSRGITVRSGDYRMLRKSAGMPPRDRAGAPTV